MTRLILAVYLLSLSAIVAAASDNPWVGTWILREPEPGGQLTLNIEEVSEGWKLMYTVIGPGAPGASYTTVVTPLNGKDAPVMIDGKTSGQTMGITKIDDLHTVNVIKYEGKEIGTSKTELSSDGKIIKVETDYPDSNLGAPASKQIQFWDKK
ncbi:hypothetical protein W02_35620 [Nitrospira sp. KM1]|uniref:hypothetical protein n=1 Tax=Nitrospira sp. KM1 TaxID=1936990 RepID=UPI0013A73818|nr:hypothetical protein [Nitrospira sp. KM1]BCA56422.1 hypothetical protein W02_35620 [Nitrospira sp. KM1]